MSSTTIWYTMRASGVVALVLLSATMTLGILTAGRAKSRTWPAFAQADLHKRISILAMVFLALHVLTAVLDTYVHVGWAALVVPFASGYQPFWVALGTVGVDLILALAISGALRQRIAARTWRAIHWVAYASWPVAMAHSLGMGTDAGQLWMDALAGMCCLAVVLPLAWRIRAARTTGRAAATDGGGTGVRARTSASPDRRRVGGTARPAPARPISAATASAPTPHAAFPAQIERTQI
jgi:sulfoxide reductase heme-binding subunit YedZ